MTNILSHAVIRECLNPECKFRFPDTNYLDDPISCPLCGCEVVIKETIDLTEDNRKNINFKSSIEFIPILDNVRSVYNVGAIFRTAAGYGLHHAHLCGITPTPKHKNFTKTSLGAENFISWEKSLNCVDLCKSLKDNGYQIISIESTTESISLINVEEEDLRCKKIAIIIGNEISGIDPKVIMLSDLVISIPIIGENKSFNVTTALGIALFHLVTLASI